MYPSNNTNNAAMVNGIQFYLVARHGPYCKYKVNRMDLRFIIKIQVGRRSINNVIITPIINWKTIIGVIYFTNYWHEIGKQGLKVTSCKNTVLQDTIQNKSKFRGRDKWQDQKKHSWYTGGGEYLKEVVRDRKIWKLRCNRDVKF